MSKDLENKKNHHDKSSDLCIIPDLIDINWMIDINTFIDDFCRINKENMHRGINWYYTVTSNNDSYKSFLFNRLDLIQKECPAIVKAFKVLFDVYKNDDKCMLGDWGMQISNQFSSNDELQINPHIFSYDTNQSHFGWHAHRNPLQKFQAVVDISSYDEEVEGGYLQVVKTENKNELQQILKQERDLIINLNSLAKAGDVMCFPYHFWHRVSPVKNLGKFGLGRRYLLMPLEPRSFAGKGNLYFN